MIYYIIFIILTFVLAYVNNKVSKKLFYPPLYLCFIWILFVVIHLLYILFLTHKPNMLSLSVLFYFFGVIFLFSLGGIISVGLFRKESKPDIKFTFNSRFISMIVLLNLMFLVLFMNKIKEITGSYFDLLLFRYYTSIERVDIGLIKYSITFSIYSTLLMLVDYFNKGIRSIKIKFKLILMFIASFSLAFLSASRGTFLFLLISCLGIYSVYNRINVKLVIKTIGITLAIFIIMATLLKKSMPNEHKTNIEYSAFEKVEYFLYVYGTLPLSAFDKFINEPYIVTNGDILFRFPKAILYKTGIIDSPPKDLVERYVRVPDLVNVHTAYYKIIKDFGIIYSLTLMFLLGYLHTYFFIGSKKVFGNLIGFATLLFPLTMTFFEENYISVFSTWIQLILFVFLTNKFIKKQYV